MKLKLTIIASSLALSFAVTARADELSDIKAQLKSLTDQIQQIQEKQKNSDRAEADAHAALRDDKKKPEVVPTAKQVVAPDNPGTKGIDVWDRGLTPIEFVGTLDIGLYNFNNVGGESLRQLYSSYSQFGIRGTRQIADGVIGFYDLKQSALINNGQFKTGVSLTNGAVSRPAVAFDRGAYMGLASPTLGAISAGRQYDFLYGTTLALDSVVIQGGLSGGFQGFEQPKGIRPAVDIRYGGAIYDNSIKWVKSFGALSGGLMYALGSSNGASPNGGGPDPTALNNSPNSDQMYSAYLKYTMSNFMVGIGYVRDNFTTSVFANEAMAIKAQYDIDRWTLFANYGEGRENNKTQPASKAVGRPFEMAANYKFNDKWSLGGGLGKNWATTRDGQTAVITQSFGSLVYSFDAKAKLYLRVANNQSSNTALIVSTFGSSGGQSSPSTSDSVNAVAVGYKYAF